MKNLTLAFNVSKAMGQIGNGTSSNAELEPADRNNEKGSIIGHSLVSLGYSKPLVF